MASASVQTAAFAVDEDGLRIVEVDAGSGERLRCASVLKPLMFWVAYEERVYRDLAAWSTVAEPAVVVSANDPMAQLWRGAGAERLLAGLAARTGREWTAEGGGEGGFGRVLVTAADVAAGYGALVEAARAGAQAPLRLLGWMREVPERQTFGARAAAAAALGVEEAAVGVKCGWYIARDETRLRTHAVTLAELPDGSVRGSAVLTAVQMKAPLRVRYGQEYVHGDEVLDHHWELAADDIRAATAAALA